MSPKMTCFLGGKKSVKTQSIHRLVKNPMSLLVPLRGWTHAFAMGLLTLGAECKNCTETHSNILSLNSQGLNAWSQRLLGEADKRDRLLQAQKQKWLDYL